jgi:hypothetical protein
LPSTPASAPASASLSAASLMRLGPDELDAWLAQRTVQLQHAQQQARVTPGLSLSLTRDLNRDPP